MGPITAHNFVLKVDLKNDINARRGFVGFWVQSPVSIFVSLRALRNYESSLSSFF